MDGWSVFVIALLGVTSVHQLRISHSVMAGDNITLYCDCKKTTGIFIVWYRNCSHQNQPPLMLNPLNDKDFNKNEYLNIFPRYKFINNDLSKSYDLEIQNITTSDEGIYYCGTQRKEVADTEQIALTYVFTYGNGTNVTVDSSDPHAFSQNCDKCWTLLFSLSPVVAVVSSLFSSLLVYHVWRNTGMQKDGNISNLVSKTRINQGEDVFYAPLNIHFDKMQGGKCTTLTFCTYSAIKTSRM